MYNQPESIQKRNMEALAEEMRLREEREKEKNKFKRLKRLSRDSKTHDQTINDLNGQQQDDYNDFMQTTNQKFVPIQEKERELIPSPIGKFHTVGPLIRPEVVKENFEGERNMLRIFEAIRRQPPGFFLYLTHTYQKSSNKYNFYNVK
jgi:hypothetical protein